MGQRVEVSKVSTGISFPGGVELPPAWEKEEKEYGVRAAIEEAGKKERDPDTIWTDGSKLESGGFGAAVAWYKEKESAPRGSMVFQRRGFSTAGQRREKAGNTYHSRHRSIEARSGWRSRGFGMGGGHEAYDAEPAALVYGLIRLHGRGEVGHTHTIFTESTAAMRQIVKDAPGAGQEMAIELARRIIDQGNSITVRWTPAHRGVEGNERADRAAKDVASLPPLRATRRHFSLAFLRRRATARATQTWRRNI